MTQEEKNKMGTISIETFDNYYTLDKWVVKSVEIWKNEKLTEYNTRDFDLPDNYEIHITTYKYKGPEHYWDVKKIEIYKDGEFYIGFGRDYHSFTTDQFIYLKQTGEDGIEREFIITTSQYMFITIINLTDKIINSDTFGQPKLGAGFCPIKFTYEKEWTWNNDGVEVAEPNELMVEGCYWACPYERYYIKGIDFSKDLKGVFTENNPNVTRTDDEGAPYEDDDSDGDEEEEDE